jgi:hypothetical protein
VYGEDEYLTEEHKVVEETCPTDATDRQKDQPVVASSRPHGSRSARLVGLGLLVGVTTGAVGLVVLNRPHRASVPPSLTASRGTPTHVAHPVSGAGSVARRASVAHRASADVPANSESARRRSVGALASHAPAGYASDGLVAHPRVSKSPTTGRELAMSLRQSTSLPAVWQVDGPMASHTTAPASSPDGEFDFER